GLEQVFAHRQLLGGSSGGAGLPGYGRLLGNGTHLNPPPAGDAPPEAWRAQLRGVLDRRRQDRLGSPSGRRGRSRTPHGAPGEPGSRPSPGPPVPPAPSPPPAGPGSAGTGG